MAKKHSNRRKARKPKFIEIDGHQLTPAMHIDYLRCLGIRQGQKTNRTPVEVERVALGDFLSGYRPSHKIKDLLADISMEITSTGLAIAAMRDYSFYQRTPSVIRKTGCQLVKELAAELQNAAARLTFLAAQVADEEEMKLQDWLAQDEAFERIGEETEVSHE